MVQLNYTTLTTKNGQVGYCTLGSGPPLVLIVGYSGTLYHWNKHFIYELAKAFTVYLVDNRLIGLSHSTNEYSMAGMAQDIVDFMEAHRLVKPVIFGWSMGGIITQTLVARYPALASAAILLATVPHTSYTREEFVNLVANSQHLPASEFRQQLYRMFFSANLPGDQLKELITGGAPTISNYHYRFNFAAKELQDYAVMAWPGIDQQTLANIKVPVLVLCARNDLVVREAASQVLAGSIPNAKLIIYPSGGHFLLQDKPQLIARDMINFALSI